jgi:hypothetical protein
VPSSGRNGGPTAELSSCDVQRRGHHPACRPWFLAQAAPASEGSSERLLRRILRHVPIPTDEVRGPEHRAEFPLVEIAESLIAGTHPPSIPAQVTGRETGLHELGFRRFSRMRRRFLRGMSRCTTAHRRTSELASAWVFSRETVLSSGFKRRDVGSDKGRAVGSDPRRGARSQRTYRPKSDALPNA